MTRNLLKRDIERELLPMAEGYGMTVTAWSPLAGGVLSGKFTRPGGPEPGTRLAPQSVTDHDRAVARAVQEMAGELGVTPAQVAIAWTRSKSQAVIPILGARRRNQLIDNLGALDLELSAEATQRLEAATGFTPRFPAEFIAETSGWVIGEANRRLGGRNAASG